MLTLEQSEPFQTEYKMFQSKISKIQDEALHKELSGLLQYLLKEVRKLDEHHKELGATNKLPMFMGDTRSTITEVRQKLMKKLRDVDELTKTKNV